MVAPCTHPIVAQWFEGKRDVILFCIDCSESMQESREDPVYEGVQTSHLLVALDGAMQIQKRKAIVGPADSVGILLFNTVRGRTLMKLNLIILETDQSTRRTGLWSRSQAKHFLAAADRNHQCIKN